MMKRLRDDDDEFYQRIRAALAFDFQRSPFGQV